MPTAGEWGAMARGVESIRRTALGTLGAVLLLIGVALLVLPGPGLLLVFAGVVLLARAIPALDRFVAPVRVRAMRAAEESVSSRWRIAGSVLVGLFLLAAGVAWGLVPELPYSGWATGASLIVSGFVLFALLGWSHGRVRAARRGSPPASESTR
ncbi:putative membrane protein [Streptomyces tendae]